MIIPQHKIKAAIVFVLAIGIGIGVPLLSRLKSQDSAANILQQQPQNNVNQDGNLIALMPSVPTVSCTANPPAVYVGDQVTWQVSTTNVTYPDLLTYTWSGAVTGTGKTVTSTHSMAAAYSATVTFNDFELGTHSGSCSVNVLEKPTQQPAPSPEPTPSPSPTPEPSPTPPPAESINTSSSDQPAAADLTPAPDIMSCKVINASIILSEQQISIMKCTLKPPASINAWIIKGDYTPPNDPDPASVIKTLVYQKLVYDQSFSFNWNGIDSYDNPVADGDYTFVVAATVTNGVKADISIQKVHVTSEPPPQTQETSSQQTTEPTSQTPPPPVAPPPPPPAPPPPPEPSKCPGINYPKDIEGHWAKDYIRTAYDNCIMQGYGDGTFRADQKITRGEAVKVALIGAGVPPKLGCYDTDCGTPFLDLINWQSQWIRAAWDSKIVKGITSTLFVPGRAITRGEAVVLIAKAFGVSPHKNCYTPNCGAGYPSNFFLDVNDPVLGSYLRALWDRGIIKGTGPNTFDPNRELSRAEMAALVVKLGEVLGKIHVSAPAPSPAPPAANQESSTQQASSQQQT